MVEQLFGHITSLLKLPIVALAKTIFTLLNIIPLKAYEFQGVRGFSATNRPDLRENGFVTLGDRVHLGTFLIAYTRGAVKRKETGNGQKWIGVWTETYRDIQSKWIW